MWEVIEESKAGKEFMTSRTQYKNLEKILSKLPKENIKKIEEEWQGIVNKWGKDGEFDKLHKGNGGFVNTGDVGFYMDFANWLVAQGETLYKDFNERGHIAVIEYKRKHKVAPKDYRYECMGYVFQQFWEDK